MKAKWVGIFLLGYCFFLAGLFRGMFILFRGRQGRYKVFFESAPFVLLVIFTLFVCLYFSGYWKRRFTKVPLCFLSAFFFLFSLINAYYTIRILPKSNRGIHSSFTPRRLSDKSLFTLMYGRNGKAHLVYALLRKEARNKTVYFPVNCTYVEPELIKALTNVAHLQEYDQSPDEFISSLGMGWSVVGKLNNHNGFEFAKFEDIVILGRGGGL